MKKDEIKPDEQLTLAQINRIRKQAQADGNTPKQDARPVRSKKAEQAATETEPNET